jgi:hypothetical protein
MSELAKHGTLQELSLSDIEQVTLMHVARYGPAALRTSIAAAMVSARGEDGVTEEVLFKLLHSADSIDDAQPGVKQEGNSPEKEFNKGMCLLLLLAAQRELSHSNEWQRERAYLQSLNVTKRTELMLLMGAVLKRPEIALKNPDLFLVTSFVKIYGAKLTEADCAQIPLLKNASQADSRWKIVPLVLASCGIAGLLWSLRKEDGTAKTRVVRLQSTTGAKEATEAE